MDADNKALVLMIMYGKSVGGAEFQFIELANYLAVNHAVRLVSLGGDGSLQSVRVDSRIELQIYPYDGTVKTILNLTKAFLENLSSPSKYVVTTSFIGNLLGWMIGVFKRRRMVSLQTVSKCMRHPLIDRFILKRFDVLIAGATDIREYLIAHDQDPNKIHVIHNWIDFSKRVPSATTFDTRKKLGIDNQIIIGCIGRLHPQKGQLYLVRAFEHVVAAFPDAILLLVGEGETRSTLENEVAKLDLTGKVIFTGTVVGDDYNNILAVIDIYVQPSIFEGLPRTLLDAMYMSKAIIATDINGNKEAVIHESNGLLVSAGDAQQLTTALLRLIKQPEQRSFFSANAHKIATENFSMEKKMQEIEALVFQL